MEIMPFNIFPKIGYKNEQFQIVSTVNNLKLNFLLNGKIQKTIRVDMDYPTTVLNLSKVGKYDVECNYQNKIYKRPIEVKDAYRIGSSEFNKAFVFDNIAYSFFLMKDRLLLFDEKKNIILTENHLTPSEIKQIDNDNYLFVTRIGDKKDSETYYNHAEDNIVNIEDVKDSIVNLGIYSLKTFVILGELLNNYLEISLLPENNVVWLLNKKEKSLECFELINSQGNTFNQVKRYENADTFVFDKKNNRIYIERSNFIIAINLENLDEVILPKSEKTAIDRNGYLYTHEDYQITCVNELEGFYSSMKIPDNLNLCPENFFFVGSNFSSKFIGKDLFKYREELIEFYKKVIPNEESDTYYVPLSPEQKISVSSFEHQFYPSKNGIIVLMEEKIESIHSSFIHYTRGENGWYGVIYNYECSYFSLSFDNGINEKTLLDYRAGLTIDKFENDCLILSSFSKNYLIYGDQLFPLASGESCEFISISKNRYLLIKNRELYSIYSIENLNQPILDKVVIYNKAFINLHNSVWYSLQEQTTGGDTKPFYCYNLSARKKIELNQSKAKHSLYSGLRSFKINENLILSSTGVVIDPKQGEIKDAYIGLFITASKYLNKVVSNRNDILYLSTFNDHIKKFEEKEIKLGHNKNIESYLSPNGNYLVLKKETNEYELFDIEKNETIKFFSGNFVAFSKEGNLIFEKNSTRSAKIIDPLTFLDITPPNYHHYRFLSPDGKLYAQIATKVRYIDRLTNTILTNNQVLILKKKFDTPVTFFDSITAEKEISEVEINRNLFFYNNKEHLAKLDIDEPSKIDSEKLIKEVHYSEIGIVGSKVKVEIIFPKDLRYYNYASFSYDNNYFSYVGKPGNKKESYPWGVIHLFKLEFDESLNKLTIVNDYYSEHPSKAVWVCGFSRTGYFGTYDSNPITYLIKVDKTFFENKIGTESLAENIYKTKNNLYYSYKNWYQIDGKNFLCFSPSGNFIALSNQGYEPLTLGGYGHQESNVVHIAQTNTGKIFDSFTGHGDDIKCNKRKKVVFVAFSEDEKRIMTLSGDGVIYVRDLNLSENKIDHMPVTASIP